jgi:hypothetical protein
VLAVFDGTIAHDQRQRRAQHRKPVGGHFVAAERHGEFSSARGFSHLFSLARSASCSRFLIEHDLFGKRVSILRLNALLRVGIMP